MNSSEIQAVRVSLIDAMDAITEAEERYNEAKMHADYHITAQRLIQFGDERSYEMYETLKKRYEELLTAIENLKQLERMEEANAQD